MLTGTCDRTEDDRMRKRGVKPNAITYTTSSHLYAPNPRGYRV